MEVGLFLWGLAAGLCGYAVTAASTFVFARAVPPGTLRPDFADKARQLRRQAGLGWLGVGVLLGAVAGVLRNSFFDWAATGLVLVFLIFTIWWTAWLIRRAKAEA